MLVTLVWTFHVTLKNVFLFSSLFRDNINVPVFKQMTKVYTLQPEAQEIVGHGLFTHKKYLDAVHVMWQEGILLRKLND